MRVQMQGLITQLYRSGILYQEATREFRKLFLLRVLSECDFNQCKAARELGMHRNTLSRTIAELKLDLFQLRADWQKLHPRPCKPKPQKHPRVWPENPIETLLKRGLAPAEIAKTLGRSLARVHQIRERMAQRAELVL